MKKSMTISIEEDDERVLKRMCEVMGITVSKLVEDALRGYLIAAKTSGLLHKKKATAADLLRFLGKGCTLDPHT